MHALFATEKGQIVEVVRDLERDASTALRLPASKHQRKAPLKPPHKPAPPRVTADGGRERLLRDLDAFGEAEAASRFAPSSTEDAAGRETHDLLRAVLRDARTAPAAAQAVLGSPADISPGSAHFIDCAGLLGGAVARRLAEVSVTQADFSGGGGGSGSATASRRWSVISHQRPVSAALGAAAVLDDSTLRRATVAARNTATAGRVQKHALRIAALDAELAATEAAYAAVAAEADAALGGTLSAGTAAVAGAHERQGGARAAQGERLRTVRAELVALEAAHSRAEDVARRQVAAAGADRDAAAAACDALAAARAEGEGDRDALAAIAAQVTAFERYFARIDAEAGRVEEEAAAEAARRSHKTRISALINKKATSAIWRWWQHQQRRIALSAASAVAARRGKKKARGGSKQKRGQLEKRGEGDAVMAAKAGDGTSDKSRTAPGDTVSPMKPPEGGTARAGRGKEASAKMAKRGGKAVGSAREEGGDSSGGGSSDGEGAPG